MPIDLVAQQNNLFDRVFALAFDHRNSFRTSFMRLVAAPTAEQTAQMIDAKRVVVDALLQARPSVVDGTPTLLIDAESGVRHVAAARDAGVAIAMPMEVRWFVALALEGVIGRKAL